MQAVSRSAAAEPAGASQMQAYGLAKRQVHGMAHRSRMLRGVLAVSVLVLASCGDTSVGGGSGFQSRYLNARTALERGDYDRARARYQKLINEAGPLAPRLQLEYAHAELRAGNYPAAAQVASALAQGQTGTARATALAVQGTAQHEQGLALLAQGDTSGGKAQLVAARAALAEVLKAGDELDPLGSMAGRHASIGARLKRL